MKLAFIKSVNWRENRRIGFDVYPDEWIFIDRNQNITKPINDNATRMVSGND